jgi:hypothetical protein
VIAEEVVVVLALSLLASAVYAVISILEAPIRGVTVASASQSTVLARQLAGVAPARGSRRSASPGIDLAATSRPARSSSRSSAPQGSAYTLPRSNSV